MRDAIRLEHYAYSTEKTHVYRAKRWLGRRESPSYPVYLALKSSDAYWSISMVSSISAKTSS